MPTEGFRQAFKMLHPTFVQQIGASRCATLFNVRYASGMYSRLLNFSTSTRLEVDHSSAVELATQEYFPKESLVTKSSTIVLLHGLFGSKRNWDSIAKSFRQKGFKVITMDLRNHGDSPHSPDMDYGVMTEDVKLTLGKLHVDNTIVLGHSMGGRVAMNLALTEPDLVHRLIVEDVAPRSKSRGTKLPGISRENEGYIAALKGVYFDDSLTPSEERQYVGEQLLGVMTDENVRSFILTNIVRRKENGHQVYDWQFNLNALEKSFEALGDFPHHDTSYSKPTLFIGGEYSRYILKEDYSEIKRLFPNSTIQHIEKAGHWVHADQAWQFINSILNFINEDSPGKI